MRGKNEDEEGEEWRESRESVRTSATQARSNDVATPPVLEELSLPGDWVK